MIRITKGPKPKILEKNAEVWTHEYLAALACGNVSKTVANRYNKLSIKKALLKETFGKCAYCESKLQHISFGDIEHILPKKQGARPELYVVWSNLTIACEQCNRTGKHDYYDPTNPLVNPYIDDPNDHMMDIDSLILPNDSKGRITIEILDLNRLALVEKRDERLKSIARLYRLWEKEADAVQKEALASELKRECTADKEYASTIRSFLHGKGFEI